MTHGCIENIHVEFMISTPTSHTHIQTNKS